MNPTKSIVPLIFIVSVLMIISIEASPSKPRNTKPIDLIQPSVNESPYWEYILREFVFKTISSPSQLNNVLYKKLLEAPFYSGPLPTASSEDNALLSRGDVYHLPDGRWILCQEGCENCKPCINQKDSLVKWTLRRIKRFISSNSYRYDLQLTVEPQREVSLANFGAGRNIYVSTNQLNPSELSTSTQESHIDRSRSRSWRRMQRDQNGQLDRHEVVIGTEEHSTVNSNSKLLLNSFENNSSKDSAVEPTHQLIVGFDQLGNKHVIHILSTNFPEKPGTHLREGHQSMNNNVKYQKINYYPQLSPYQLYIQRLVDSIYTHRPFVEAFLMRGNLNKKLENTTKYLNFVEMSEQK